MQDRAMKFINDGLAHSGLAVLDSAVAFELRRDLWPTRFGALTDMATGAAVVRAIAADRRALVFDVQIEGFAQRTLVIAKSGDDLARRIEWIIGRRVLDVRPYAEPAAEPAPAARAATAEEIPGWPCQARRDALAKRGEKDDVYRDETRLPPRRASL